MQVATYLILAVVALLVVYSIMCAVYMALQIIVVSVAVCLVVWALVALSKMFKKTTEVEEPPS